LLFMSLTLKTYSYRHYHFFFFLYLSALAVAESSFYSLADYIVVFIDFMLLTGVNLPSILLYTV